LPIRKWNGGKIRAGPAPLPTDRTDTVDFDQQTEDLIDVDDKVVVLVRWVGRGKASGAQGEISMAMIWTCREQAITRIEFFLDRAQALRAAGLRE
jgi:ketosteroid isomerase-like protein